MLLLFANLVFVTTGSFRMHHNQHFYELTLIVFCHLAINTRFLFLSRVFAYVDHGVKALLSF
jgi:hypothetical protein